jgi:hypothetical protein
VTSTRRAILVSRDETCYAPRAERPKLYPTIATEAFDNAGDQPRIHMCVNPGHARPNGWPRPATDEKCFRYATEDPCRVVTAIIVLEEDA